MPPLAPKIKSDSPSFKPSVVSRPARAVTASTAMAAAFGMGGFSRVGRKTGFFHNSILRIKSALRIQKGNSVNAVPFFKPLHLGSHGFNSAGPIGSQYKWKHGLDIELFRKSAFPFKGIPNADASGFHMNQHFIGSNGRDGKLLSF